jgi:hypothetical protein
MKRNNPPAPNEGTPKDATTRPPRSKKPEDLGPDVTPVNPPRTTTGPVTSPKFGSAGSGGAELEPGPKRP